jgi:hypothetical protein
MSKIDFGGAKCAEANNPSAEKYVPCGKPAETVVLVVADGRAYMMCGPCADDSVQRRMGRIIARKGVRAGNVWKESGK